MASAMTAAIEQDLTCGGCDYNLRGLPRDGACPECGRAVAATLSGVPPTAWLRRVSWGAALIGGLSEPPYEPADFNHDYEEEQIQPHRVPVPAGQPHHERPGPAQHADQKSRTENGIHLEASFGRSHRVGL